MSGYSYDEQKAIGEKVKDRISALGFTRAQVAEESKISVASLRMIINGQKYPTGPQIKRLCVTLKITPNYLLFGTENPSLLKGESDEEVAYEIFKTSFLKSSLDRDNSAMIDRLILSMLSDQYKKAEYAGLIEFAEYFSNKMAVYLAPTMAAIEKADLSKGKDNKEKARMIRTLLGEYKEELKKSEVD